MTDERRPSDDQLLEMLRDSLEHSVEVTNDAIDMLMTGYDIVHTDVVEAELTFDSLAASGVRGGEGAPRHLRFEHETASIDIELSDVALRCAGRVEPAGGSLHLEQISGVREIQLSESGAFDETVEGVGPFRLRYDVAESMVSTAWLQFGAAEF